MDVYGLEIRGYLGKEVQIDGHDKLMEMAEKMAGFISPTSEFIWYNGSLYTKRHGKPGANTGYKIVHLKLIGDK